MHWQAFVEEAGDAGRMDFGTYKEISAVYSLNSFCYFQICFSLNWTTKVSEIPSGLLFS